MTEMIRIPSRFIDDHYDRSLPTPEDIEPSDRDVLFGFAKRPKKARILEHEGATNDN